MYLSVPTPDRMHVLDGVDCTNQISRNCWSLARCSSSGVCGGEGVGGGCGALKLITLRNKHDTPLRYSAVGFQICTKVPLVSLEFQTLGLVSLITFEKINASCCSNQSTTLHSQVSKTGNAMCRRI